MGIEDLLTVIMSNIQYLGILVVILFVSNIAMLGLLYEKFSKMRQDLNDLMDYVMIDDGINRQIESFKRL